MRKWLLIVIITFVFLSQGILFAQSAQDDYRKTHPIHGVKEDWEDEALQSAIDEFEPTDPPIAPIRQVAEFEPMEGVLVAYNGLGYMGIPVEVIREISEDVTVTTVLANVSAEFQVRNWYQTNNVNMENCNFIYHPVEYWWTRDYGPWYIADSSNSVGIVDFRYNRPRPIDDDTPIIMAESLNVELYGMDMYHVGGNYMCDGMGVGASTQIVWTDNPSLSHADIDQLVWDYLGIHTYHVLPDAQGLIGHIDCWGKFLDVDKVIVAQVPQSDPRYNTYEYVADYFTNHTSSYGNSYQVYRVYAPGTGYGSPWGGGIRTPYTNSLIVNDKVFVPITGCQYDAAALAVYEEAMPGYEIIAVMEDGAYNGWWNMDGLHCRVKGTADRGMLYIHHRPLSDEQEVGIDYDVIAYIIPYSEEALYEDSLLIYYQVDGGTFNSVPMTLVSDVTYQGFIPAQTQGSEVGYYIHAADESGRSENHPYIGEPDPHDFHVITSGVAGQTPVPVAAKLFENYPNPFNNETVIRYQLAQSVDIELAIYNIRGRKIKTLVNGWMNPGDHRISWDGKNASGLPLASGVYFYQLNTGIHSVTNKMVLLK